MGFAGEDHRQAGLSYGHRFTAPSDTGNALPRVGVLARVDHALAVLMQLAATIPLVAEIMLLLVGLVSRFFFNRPLIWSEERASFLLFWLAMVEAAIAHRRGQHMRLTALVRVLKPHWRHFLETMSTLLMLLFAVVIIVLSYGWAVCATCWNGVPHGLRDRTGCAGRGNEDDLAILGRTDGWP